MTKTISLTFRVKFRTNAHLHNEEFREKLACPGIFLCAVYEMRFEAEKLGGTLTEGRSMSLCGTRVCTGICMLFRRDQTSKQKGKSLIGNLQLPNVNFPMGILDYLSAYT